jgi:O-antigen ligase
MSTLTQRWTRDLDLPVEPWWLLWVLAICVAWLLPTHLIPWRSYHAEMAMVLALLPAALWAALRRPQPGRSGTVAIVFFVLALSPFMQWAAGQLHFAGDAWLVGAYLFAFALAIVTGLRLEQVAPGHTASALFAAFAVASLLSTGLVLYQLLQVSGLGLLTLEFPYGRGYRPFGNLGQPNQLATLLVWGLVAFWWLYLTGRARGWIVVAAAAFLLVGVAATQSRTAWVELAVLAVAAALWRTPLATRRCLPGLTALGVGFIVLVANWGSLIGLLEFGQVRSLEQELTSAGLRPSAWRLFADAVARQPWGGWGWNQMAVAQSAVALDHPGLGYTFQSTHNLVLDLLVQIGVPATLALVVGFGVWFVVQLRRVSSATNCLLLLAIVVLLVHAMLEFPQNYTYFLLPAGLMIGVLESAHPSGPSLALPRWLLVLLVAIGIAGTAWIASDYRRAEVSLELVRMERNRVGFARNSVAPDLQMLTQLREFLRFLRASYTAPATPEQLDALRRVVEQYPSDGNHLAFAVAAASNGRADLAGQTLARMCRMVPRSRCDDALANWRAMSKESPKLAAVPLPR